MGASNYCSLYQNIPAEYQFAEFRRVNAIPGGKDPQGDIFSIMDKSWIHVLNALKWSQTAKNYYAKEQKSFLNFR